MANRLRDQPSPYLLQHAENPVDWYPWGDEAFTAARDRDVPIFLSVGYSSCHWCHVMAHESFEDDHIAARLNELFVNVKVDREERPDVDAVYMRAVQSMTGRGGWPMSVFLTPDREPFYAGTYWPKQRMHGMASFPQVIEAIGDAWRDRRDEVLSSATEITTALATHRDAEVADAIDVTVTDDAARVVLERAWDRSLGGFGAAPKFPQAMTIEWLLARHLRTGDADALTASVQALDAMARGGIHDQLAGGFARYSTDARWLVPHFEKMLYDNALLLPAYATAAAITGDDTLVEVAASIARYLLQELRTEDGTFVSATDADSEGVEGRFFVWSHEEFTEVLTHLGEDAELWAAHFGVVPEGNWEGTNVLHEPTPRHRFVEERGLDTVTFGNDRARVASVLLERRNRRVPPGVDDKVLTDWNALAIRGLVRAGVLLGGHDWVAAAAEAAERLHDHLVVDGRLHHVAKDGAVAVPAFLEDHALLALADLELLQATGDLRWFDRALELAERAHADFHDAEEGGWFQTAHDAEALYTRPKETWDNATPAGTSVMIEVCLTLAGLTGDTTWRVRAEDAIRTFQEAARRMPTGYGWFLRQVEALAAGPREVAIVGPDGEEREALRRTATSVPYPGTTVLVADDDHGAALPLLVGRSAHHGTPVAYVCRDLTCDAPTSSVQELRAALDGRSDDLRSPDATADTDAAAPDAADSLGYPTDRTSDRTSDR